MADEPRLRSFHSLGPHGFHEIAYTEWGDPNARRLVFCVHGFTRNARDFDALARALSDRCHVVCMDVAGRGQSEWLPHKGDYSFGLYLNDAAALLARVTAPEQPSRLRRMLGGRGHPARRHLDWVGTSMGGLMGIMLAAKRQSPIRKLVLNDVGPLVPWSALMGMKQAHSGIYASFATLHEAEAYFREAYASFGPLTDAQWRHVAEHGTLRKGSSYIQAFDPAIVTHMRGGAVAGVEFGADFLYGLDVWPTYDAVRCPTLVLRGAESKLLPKATAAAMKRRGPKARVAEFEGIGHAPWLMTEDQIKVVREFLQEEHSALGEKPAVE